jgi:hypothetical protein
MIRNLKALGLALLAICALGAVAAQAASAAKEHEFHSDGPATVITGEDIEGNHTFAVGAAGTVECTTAEFEATQTGSKVSTDTYAADTLTVTPHYSGCTFGGQPATVNFNHCAYVFESETTEGTPGQEHASAVVQCSKGTVIEVDTSVCTITVGPQTINHAVRYENDTAKSIKIFATAKKVVTGKKKTTEAQTGCLLFPTGEIGTYTGTATASCFKDEGSPLTGEEGTEATTPTGLTKEGDLTTCSVTNT